MIKEGVVYMTKKSFRESTLSKMTSLSGAERDKAEASLVALLDLLVKEKGHRKIAAYYGSFPELTTEKIFEHFKDSDVEIYLPRMEPKRQLGFHRYEVGDEVEVTWGLNQPLETAPKIDPADLDLIIVPGVAFSPEGYRVGFGGGYYDRLLAKVDTPTVSLIFQEQAYESGLWPVEDHDQGVDQVFIDRREEF